MTQSKDHVEALKAFRNLYVEERRRIVSTALVLRRSAEGAPPIGEFQRIQEQIERIDRALGDETKLQQSEAYDANMRQLGQTVTLTGRRKPRLVAA